ncbi:MAG: hypothetical protein QF471_06905, partial [Phycisphaerales bacterium]|nr:hypothetical protein [Phycisphaerales bacterium]
MTNRRLLQPAVWTVMAVTTAGVVLAAKPAARDADSPAARAERITAMVESVVGPSLQVPEDLQRHRLKIRLAPHLRGRLLPNGDLLSLNGYDLTELSDLFAGMGARLTPAVKTSEADINRLTFLAAFKSGGTQTDIAATFWVDVDERDTLDRVARKLDRLSEVEMVAFSRSRTPSSPTWIAPPKTRKPSRTGAAAAEKELVSVGDLILDPPDPLELLDHLLAMQPALPDRPSEADMAAASVKAARALAQRRMARPAFYQGDSARGRGPGSACCTFTYDGDREMWDRDCLTLTGDEAEDTCEAMAVDGQVVVVFSEGLSCADACVGDGAGGGGYEGYGACCDAAGVRGGEDMLASECEDPAVWNGGDLITETSFFAYSNCSSCELVIGACCFGEDAIDQTFEFFPVAEEKFAACDLNNPQPPISNSAYGWFPPIVEPLPLNSYTEQFDTVGWALFQNWMGFDVTGMADTGLISPTNLQVISSARLVGNSEDETACERCTSFDGYFMGDVDPLDPATYTVTFYGGELLCGDPTATYISACDPVNVDPDAAEKTILGSCAQDGELVVMSLDSCIDAADAQSVGVRTIWQAAMLDPAYIETDPAMPDFGLHAVHQNQWRPNWALYFTPPATETPDPTPFSAYNEPIYTWCPPKNPDPDIPNEPPYVDPLCEDPADEGLEVPPNYLVPFWEYAGTYVEWTGWNPARWWAEGVTMRQTTEDDFLVLVPPLSNGLAGGSGIASQLFPAVATEDAVWPADQGGRYDISVRFGLAPTCMELVQEYGLAQRPGEPMLWGDWPVTPVTNRWVFEYQLLGNPQNEFEDLPNNLQLYPFDYGRNRWTDDFKMFDIGQESPYPVTHGRGRYLNADQPG